MTYDQLLETQEVLLHRVSCENLPLGRCLVAKETQHQVLYCITLQHLECELFHLLLFSLSHTHLTVHFNYNKKKVTVAAKASLERDNLWLKSWR